MLTLVNDFALVKFRTFVDFITVALEIFVYEYIEPGDVEALALVHGRLDELERLLVWIDTLDSGNLVNAFVHLKFLGVIQLVDHLGDEDAIVNHIHNGLEEEVNDQKHDEDVDCQFDESRFLLFDEIMVNLFAWVESKHKSVEQVVLNLTRVKFFFLLN